MLIDRLLQLILKEPVKFCHMGMPENREMRNDVYEWQLKPESQVDFLGRMMDIFQSEGYLRRFKSLCSRRTGRKIW